MKILAIDFGKAKIGLALSLGDLAQTYGTISFKKEKETLQNLAKICESEGIGKIIFGLPKPDIIGAKRFASHLNKITNIPIIFINEVMTSEMAKLKLIEKGEKNLKNKIHSAAAALILQEYLDSN